MKARFAPSPTGDIHLGNARTALFNILFAQNQHGSFLLRIEDTDLARSSIEFSQQLQQDLHWLKIDWQEGPVVGGEFEPYEQSNRQEIYDQYYQQLQHAKLVYPCFCSDKQLELMRKLQLSSGQAPRYTGTCRNLTADQVAEKFAHGEQATLRFHVPIGQMIEFDDLVRGPQRFASDDIGDFIIRRADKTASFIFCSPLDDALMGVTHVLRGDDHLTNTPRQLLLLQALGLPAPHYGHIALILGDDGTPLSKRNGSYSIKQLRESGFLPNAVRNYLARLGHYYSQPEWLTDDDLINKFNVKGLSTSPARFDYNQLLYWQKVAVSYIDQDALWDWMGTEVANLVPESQREQFIAVIRHNVVFPVDAVVWANIIFTDIDYSAEAIAVLTQTDKQFFSIASQALAQHGTDFEAICKHLQQQLPVKGKALFQPLRYALTGVNHGPQMADLLKLLGTSKAAARLARAGDI